jgi:protein O-GlcNAc transferase
MIESKLHNDNLLQLALQFHNDGDLKQASKIYDEILLKNINHPDANHLSGLVDLENGDLKKAAKKIEEAIKSTPNQAIFHNSLGNVFKAQGEEERAEQAYILALEIEPSQFEAHYNLGKLYEQKLNLEDAENYLSKAVNAFPNSYESNYSLARLLAKLGRYSGAIKFFQKTLAIRPKDAKASNGMGICLEKTAQLINAIQYYEQAIASNPNGLATLNNLANALHASGRTDEAVEYYRKFLEIEPDNQEVWDRYLFALVFSENSDNELIYKENKRWATLIEKKISLSKYVFNPSLEPNKKIRIGYYSKEFYACVSSLFFETLLVTHDRNLFEIYCYSDCTKTDEVTKHLKKQSDVWRDVSQIDLQETADQIRLDQINIFVGTSNYLSSARMISAYQPAPIIVSYMNQVSTTGLSDVGYLIVDEHISPVDSADDFFTEKLIRLTNSICYRAPQTEIEIKQPPVIKNGYITFGCFNNSAKINQTVVLTWSKILHQVQNSRLLLICHRYHDKTMQAYFRNLFAKNGISNDRVTFRSTVLEREAYLNQYNLIDIALDPFPFAGGTVSDETLYMGTPLITLIGNREMSCIGRSKLSGLNLSDLVANTVNEYIGIANKLAADVDQIINLKSNIRERAFQTIFNSKNHVKELEGAYQKMWKKYCAEKS